MAFTGNWTWESINETLDVNIDESGTRTTRNNWTAIRHRYSNEDYASELGDEQETIGGYYGATYYERTTNPLNYIQFGTTQNWTDSSYKYYADYSVFFSGTTGDSVNAFEIGDNYTNKPVSTKTTIIRPVGGFDGASYWRWECGEWDVGDDSWKTLTNTTTNYILSPKHYQTSIPPVNGETFSTATGTFLGSSTASDEGLPQPVDWYCSNDAQNYEIGQDWYKQTQTWIYKDEYQ